MRLKDTVITVIFGSRLRHTPYPLSALAQPSRGIPPYPRAHPTIIPYPPETDEILRYVLFRARKRVPTVASVARRHV